MHLQMEQGGWGGGGGEGKRREACVNSCMVHELKTSGTYMYVHTYMYIAIRVPTLKQIGGPSGVPAPLDFHSWK